MTLRVIAAAINYDGLIFSVPAPGRHHNVIHAMVDAGVKRNVRGEDQGFLLSDGRWCSRRAAEHIAREAGQIKNEKLLGSILTSEDLW